MRQRSLAEEELEKFRKATRRETFLADMDQPIEPVVGFKYVPNPYVAGISGV